MIQFIIRKLKTDNKIVFISDESHHINTLTKKETKTEEDERNSWEYSVTNALAQNIDSIMLEFTATADLKDRNVDKKDLAILVSFEVAIVAVSLFFTMN